ncbi:MAG: Rrf2 family transcriptional regulator [Proteobacteria bacterium]|nr:Rrf2 family transcriptional regulator [Pseudomonadota bacterium]
MRLLASTDIALRVLMSLARLPAGHTVTVETLAQALGGLSRHHLHKIVQQLTGLGLTRTTRGISGGVGLAADPASVVLGKLIRQLEGEQPLVECFQSAGCSCTLVADCRLRFMLRDANEAFYRALDAHTLADCLISDAGVRRRHRRHQGAPELKPAARPARRPHAAHT